MLDADDVTAAIGDEPLDYAQAIQWRAAAVAVDEVALELAVEELGIDL